MLLNREVESRMHAHIEEHNRTIRSVPQRDLIKNPYTREEIEKQIVKAINFRESSKYPVNDKEYYNHIDINKVNDLSGFPKKIPSFAKQVDIHLKPPKAIEDLIFKMQKIMLRLLLLRVRLNVFLLNRTKMLRRIIENTCLLYCQKNGLK